MKSMRRRLLSSAVLPAMLVGTGLGVAVISFAAPAEAMLGAAAAPAKVLPEAKPRPQEVQLAACNPCNPCAAKKRAANPCNPCNPCAAKKRAANPCNPCNPCAAKGCNPCSPCGAGKAVQVNPCKAAELYAGLKATLGSGYARSGNATAKAYQGWTNVAKFPYPAATHGGRYVNNYVNAVGAEQYAKFEKAGPMPVGTVVAKDSFVVGGDGSATPGPLFIMEKMPKGQLPDTEGWRYSMILPDGTIFGTTGGAGSAKVQFCYDCHESVEKTQDQLFFLPAEARRN